MTDTSNDTPTKRCPQCGLECAYDDAQVHFSINRARKDGFSLKCRECVRVYTAAYRDANREMFREYDRARRKNDPEGTRLRNQKWLENRLASTGIPYHTELRAKDPERAKAKSKREYESRKEMVKARARKRWAEMPTERKDAISDYMRNWRKRNATRTRMYSFVRRGKTTAEDGAWMPEHMEYAVTHFNLTCAYCGQQMYDLFGNVIQHWDHYQPVAKGGSTRYDNMLPTCSACNLSKNASQPLEWMRRRFGKRKASAIDKRIQEYFEAVRNAFSAE